MSRTYGDGLGELQRLDTDARAHQPGPIGLVQKHARNLPGLPRGMRGALPGGDTAAVG
jgi:hypothetical protein